MIIQNLSLILIYISTIFSTKLQAQIVTKIKQEEKTIQFEGKPFFPIGFYYYPDNVADADNSELDLLIESGFNTIHIDIKDTSNCMHFFDLCQKKGIKIIAQFGSGFGHYSMGDVSFLPVYKNHPALLGWSIADDANNGKYTIDSIAIRQKIVKSQKANLPTFLSVYKNHEKGISKTPEELLRTGDVLSYEMYTIDNWGQAMGAFTKDEELLQADKEVSIFQNINLKFYNKIFVAIPQTFSWSFYTANKTAKLPTPKELRNITYTGIINGAKGVLNYTFGQKAIPDKNIADFKLPYAINLWKESVAIAHELGQLKDILLNGSRLKINNKKQKWLSLAYWKYNGKTYLIINNLHKSLPQKTNIQLLISNRLKNVFENRNASLSLKNGKLIGEIPAKEVQIYEVIK